MFILNDVIRYYGLKKIIRECDVKMTNEIEMNEITKGRLLEYVRLWKKYDHSYFWTPNIRAAGRRQAEKNNSFNFEFYFDGHDYVMSIVMNQSAKHVYVSRTLMQDGKRVTIRQLTRYIAKEELKNENRK
jgi:uncharacterized membrane-anchored protein